MELFLKNTNFALQGCPSLSAHGLFGCAEVVSQTNNHDEQWGQAPESRFCGPARKNAMKRIRALLPQAALLAVLWAGLMTFANALFAQAVQFVPTGNMSVARAQHTATLLNNGQVLVTSGQGSNDPASADLYDPSTGTFTPTSHMSTSRFGDTATLLSNGKVLFTGGSTQTQSSVASAELYDPTTGTFAATGNMTTPRVQHTATLLGNGKVLIAGGRNYNVGITGERDLNSAELYDPNTGTFTATGNMTVSHFGHTATLLNNGTVLIAGGGGQSPSFQTSAELYALPAISLSATTIAFGNETTGISSPPQSVTLTNNLPTAVNIASIAITGTNAGDFMQSNTCGTSLASGASCTVSIIFTPTATGNRSASVTIADNAPGSPQTISLTGTGIAPAPLVSLSSLVLTFTNQLVGTTSPSQQVTLNNTGFAPLNITSITVTGTNSSDFGQTNTCGSSVAAGMSCAINVTFTPAATGSRTASVSITDNAGGSPQSVSLTGTGAVPAVAFSATTLGFGSVAVGTSSGAQILTMTNTGNGTLTISSIAITGANIGDFAQTNTCGNSVAGGANCTISISFTPTASGSRTASVTITDNASGSPQSVSLVGTGLVPIASISPSSITFPNQYVGTSSLPQTITLMNTGAAPLTIASVTTSPTDFGPLSSCGNSLSVGSSCSIGVFFDPTAGGSRNGTLTITDNAGGSPQTVSLTGIGLDFSVSASSATTHTVAPGQTASYSLTVSPTGGFNQSLAFTCSGAPAQSNCAVSPNTVALNGSTAATVSVTVTTTAASLLVHEPFVSSPPGKPVYRLVLLISWLPGLALLASLLRWRWGRRPRLGYVLAFLFLICTGITMTACGGGSGSTGSNTNPGTPAGTYILAVSGKFTSGSTTLTHNTNLTLMVQ